MRANDLGQVASRSWTKHTKRDVGSTTSDTTSETPRDLVPFLVSRKIPRITCQSGFIDTRHNLLDVLRGLFDT